MKVWALIIAVLMLAGAWGIIETLEHDEPVIPKKPFKEFPRTVSNHWQGIDLTFDDETLQKLQMSDYLMRVYSPIEGAVSYTQGDRHSELTPERPNSHLQNSPIWLYIGYYQSQRTGATYHSPKNCLPGAGWQFISSEFVTVPFPYPSVVTINKVLIQKGLDQQVILYWYQDRGRIVASEYWAKAYMIWDAMTINRTDGSLIRVSIPVVTSPEAAYQQGLRFLQDVWPSLLEYMPRNDIPRV